MFCRYRAFLTTSPPCWTGIQFMLTGCYSCDVPHIEGGGTSSRKLNRFGSWRMQGQLSRLAKLPPTLPRRRQEPQCTVGQQMWSAPQTSCCYVRATTSVSLALLFQSRNKMSKCCANKYQCSTQTTQGCVNRAVTYCQTCRHWPRWHCQHRCRPTLRS